MNALFNEPHCNRLDENEVICLYKADMNERIPVKSFHYDNKYDYLSVVA